MVIKAAVMRGFVAVTDDDSGCVSSGRNLLLSLTRFVTIVAWL